jgi:hypothetical protein
MLRVFLHSMEMLQHAVCWRREILTILTSCIATFSVRMCHPLHRCWGDSYRNCHLCPQHCGRLVPTRYITHKPRTDPQSASVRNITPSLPLHISWEFKFSLLSVILLCDNRTHNLLWPLLQEGQFVLQIQQEITVTDKCVTCD